jgi:hypothetical protein
VCLRDERPPYAPRRAPAARGARRLVAALTARGHDAAASGRLVVLALAGEPPASAAEAVRAIAAAGDAPAVLALGGARGPDWDAPLRDRDLVLVALGEAEGGSALATLTLAGVEALGVPAALCRTPRSPAARWLAAAGIAAPAQLRAVLAGAIGAPA